MMRYLFLLMISVCSFVLYGQGENNIWVFGNFAGLDFSGGGAPVPFASAMGGDNEAAASVCDAAGQLLFYTNGSRVWDRNGNLMPGGSPLHNRQGSVTESTQQGALITPVIGNPGQYYIFSLTQWDLHVSGYGGRLFYSVVDMSLNNGLGDVDPLRKWIPLDFNLTEDMIAVPGDHCNVWVLVHDLDTNMFRAYEITGGGISPVPVRSYSGITGYRPIQLSVNGTPTNKNSWWSLGQLTVSPDRKTLAAAYRNSGYAELYDFDPATGIVSGSFVVDTLLPSAIGLSHTGICFSPGNSRLYIAGVKDFTTGNQRSIYQFDLTAPGIAGIKASRTRVGLSDDTHLRTGPDGKIYFAPKLYSDSVGIIHAPDLGVPACMHSFNELPLVAGTASHFTLGNEFVKALPEDTLSGRTEIAFCLQSPDLKLRSRPGYTRYVWDDGSADSIRTITAPGIYWVMNADDCHPYLDSFIVTGLIPDTVRKGSDTSFCTGQTLVLDIPSDHVVWEDGSTGPVRVIDHPGIYYADYLLPGECRYVTDTFYVTETRISFSLGNDTVVCGDGPLRLEAPAAGSGYLWQDGSRENFLVVRETGSYWLRISAGKCEASDTVGVRFARIAPELGQDTVLCHKEFVPVMLHASAAPGASVLWHDGSAGTSYTARDTGVYWVKVSDGPCSVTDSIRISSVICSCAPWVPTAFTPNGDGRNDQFRVIAEPGCLIREFTMSIYNRWGQLVYTGTDPLKGWDGTRSGMPSEAGTYMFIIRFSGGTRAIEQIIKGDLVLVR